MSAEACLSPYAVEKLLSPSGWSEPASPRSAFHLSECPSCAASLARALEEEAEFRTAVLPGSLHALLETLAQRDAEFAPAPAAPAEARPRTASVFAMARAWLATVRSLRTAAAVAAAAAAAVLVVSLWPGSDVGPAQTPPDAGAYLGLRGSPALTLYVKRGSAVFPHSPADALLVGDRVRVVPSAPGARFLLLLSADALDHTEVVYPWRGNASGPMPPPGKPLEGAFELDEALGQEQLIAFFSQAPVAAVDAFDWVAHAGSAMQSGSASLAGGPVEVAVLRFQKVRP